MGHQRSWVLFQVLFKYFFSKEFLIPTAFGINVKSILYFQKNK